MPDVRVLSTSREALEIAGEQVYRLPSLAVPPDSAGDAQDALPYGAVALFVDRALAANAGFALTDDNARAVAEICRRLDGIPLAIELAAARVKVLAPRQIAERLDQRFRLLTGGDSAALPRHQTMTALIDWSYDLLTPREQRFFESLSVFAGGCTLEAATAVCANEGEDDLDVVDLVASLVTKSLLVAELAGSEQRYRLLESSRQYAREKLIARGEQEHVSAASCARLCGPCGTARTRVGRDARRAWLAAGEHRGGELASGAGLGAWEKARCHLWGNAWPLRDRCLWRGFPLTEGRRWVRAALALVDERTPPRLIARLEHAEAEGAADSANARRHSLRRSGLGTIPRTR